MEIVFREQSYKNRYRSQRWNVKMSTDGLGNMVSRDSHTDDEVTVSHRGAI